MQTFFFVEIVIVTLLVGAWILGARYIRAGINLALVTKIGEIERRIEMQGGERNLDEVHALINALETELGEMREAHTNAVYQVQAMRRRVDEIGEAIKDIRNFAVEVRKQIEARQPERDVRLREDRS